MKQSARIIQNDLFQKKSKSRELFGADSAASVEIVVVCNIVVLFLLSCCRAILLREHMAKFDVKFQ